MTTKHQRSGWRRPTTALCAGLVTALTAGALALPALAEQDAPAGVTAPLVTADTTWRYLADDTDPGTAADPRAWTAPSFDDSAWRAGRGGFGGRRLGSTSETPEYDAGMVAATHLPVRPAGLAQNVRTYYFRTTFDVTADHLATGDDLAGRAFVDDAALVFVNGQEVVRHLVEPGTPNLSYDEGVGGGLDFTIPAASLRPGTNTLAVAVHQARADSSDIWWSLDELALDSTPDPVPDGPGPDRVVLTPTDSPETSQSFTWLATEPDETTGEVQIGPAAGGAVRTVSGTDQGRALNQPHPHFSATVTGLQPATAYRYRVGNDEADWTDWATFSTADPADTDFDYVYYGDAQTGLDSTWPKVVKMAEQTAPDSIGSVHAGDLVDSGSSDTQWDSWFAGMRRSAATTNVLAAPGNHEYAGDRMLRSWKAHFQYPANHPDTTTIGALAQRAVGDTDVARQYQAYFGHWAELARETVYHVDYQGVRFITVNATRDATFLTPTTLPSCTGDQCPATRATEVWTEYQAAWLDHVLEASPSKWNVVTFHQPVYSTSAGRDEPLLRRHWVPVFQRHDVDLVQMGHDHSYGRGYVNADRTAEPGVTDGPVYVVSNSGAKHYGLETEARNVWTNNGATQVIKGARISTYQVISVSKDRLVYRSYLAETAAGAYTVPARQLTVGSVIDEFTVHKTDDGRKRVVSAAQDPVPEPSPTPGVPDPAAQSPAGPQPGVPPLGGPSAVPQQATSVTVRKVRLRVGKRVLVWVRASAPGKARVTLRLGKERMTRTVTVGGAGPVRVALGTLSRRMIRAGGRKARVVVVLTPADPVTHQGDRTVRTYRIAKAR